MKNKQNWLLVFVANVAMVFVQPVWAEENFPAQLKFEIMSAEDARKMLNGIDVPEKIDTSRPESNIPYNERLIVTPEYYVAQYDLNNDGVSEILLYINGLTMCGSAGCSLKIYHKGDDGKMLNILGKPNQDTVTYIEFSILENTTNNYHDIILGQSAVWKWNGKFYDFANKIQQLKKE